MSFLRLDPTRVYETIKGVTPLQSVAFSAPVVNNNYTVVTATTGRRVRVMGWIAQGFGAAIGTFQFKSNSGGTFIMSPLTVPSNAAGSTHTLPITDSGYMETSTGHGLYVDITTAGVNLTVFYISYEP